VPPTNPLLYLLLSFALLSCTHDADKYIIKGIDISHYQKEIDWAKLEKDSALHFVFVKATEAHNFQDSIFQYNWSSLADSRLKRGAYHFFRPQVSAELQANNFIEMVTLAPGDFAPVLDIETLDNVAPQLVASAAAQWLSFIETHYEIKPIVYSSMDFYEKYLKAELGDYPCWIARYNRIEPNTTSWQFWQYSNRGKIDGIEGDVDLNVFVGTLAELNRLCLPHN
jgi:lysozyme